MKKFYWVLCHPDNTKYWHTSSAFTLKELVSLRSEPVAEFSTVLKAARFAAALNRRVEE